MKMVYTGFPGATGGPSHYLEANDVEKLLERINELIKDINTRRLMPVSAPPRKPRSTNFEIVQTIEK